MSDQEPKCPQCGEFSNGTGGSGTPAGGGIFQASPCGCRLTQEQMLTLQKAVSQA